MKRVTATPAATPPAASLADRIRRDAESGALSLPPLPEIANQLMDLLRDEDRADARQAGDLIQNEPAIAASIMRMSNSASFGGLRRVSDLSDAVARLGLRQVGSLVTAVAHKGNFTSEDPEKMELLHVLWDHSVVTALAAKHLATHAGGDAAESFLAGLLHDTGKLLVLKGIDRLQQSDGMRFTMPVAEELMDLLHAELGAIVLKSWKLSEPICQVARHHHDPNPGDDDVLLIRVQAANLIARKLGAHPHPDPELNLYETPEVERLHIGDLELASMMVDVEDELAEVKQLF